jgi:hypothetical protein
MKAPREAVHSTVQVAKKGNGSSKTAGMMANACAEQNVAAPSRVEMWRGSSRLGMSDPSLSSDGAQVALP